MKADGSIIIDTKIIDGGMEKGFELIKDEMSSIGITAKEVGEQIELSFSKMDVSKPIANAVAKAQQLEQQLATVTSDYKTAVSEGDDKSAERLAAKRVAVYERLEAAREKLSIELASAVQKEAVAEEKATQRKIKAGEKEAAAKKRAQEKQYKELTKPARRFGSRLREILSGALVFNLISAGLRSVTNYFGSALKSNEAFSSSLSVLRGSLMTAFQPIYEAVLPAIITLINWLNTAVQVVGRFFAALTGKSYSQMQKNAQALNKEASAIGGVGGAAKEAAKQLAAFDEINRLESTEQGGGGVGANSPIFEGIDIPSKWKTDIESLAMRVKDIFFEWDDITPELLAEKIITSIGAVAGGLIGFKLGGPGGAVVGMAVGAGLGVVLSSIIFDGDGRLSPGELLASCVAALMAIGGAIIGFGIGGPAGAAIGAVIGLGLTLTIEKTEFDGVAASIQSMLESVRTYFAETFSEGFIVGVDRMLSDALILLWDLFTGFFTSIIDNWNSFWNNIFSGNWGTRRTPDYAANYYSAAPSIASYSLIPEIPQLAKGAVIPPNKQFLAVLGDQSHGRNLEAPEDLIRQIVREESGAGNSDRLAQLLETLIAVVEGIEVGDEVIGKAAARYNRSTARARGY
ncbi:MAG: hypothetical protein IJZ56_03440 [Oscillospiraceae bacterium]|nr:hypothetical protein [Oscillospiraceae bacterium]